MDSVDVKEDSSNLNTITSMDELSCGLEVKPCNSDLNIEVVKEEKINQLNSQLETLAQALRLAESEKTRLQEEVTKANFKLLNSDKYCGELEHDLERLREEMMESALQHQLQIMHDEEALGKIRSELAAIQEDLEHSKSRGAELEQEIVSKAAIIQELTLEFDQHKTSHAHLREDLLALESLVSVLKEELRAKDDNLEEILSRLQQEMRRRETTEESLRTHELQILGLQDELYRENEVKSALEITVGVLNNHLHQLKEFCVDLENKLNVSEQNLSRYDSLLSQALSHNSELEQKLKSLGIFHNEPVILVQTSSMNKILLQDLNEASHTSPEEAKDVPGEKETELMLLQQGNLEVEQNTTQEKFMFSESDRERSEHRRRKAEVTKLLKACEEETGMPTSHFQEYEDDINRLECSLEKSLSRYAELEIEKRELEEKCTELEKWASLSHEHNQELQKLVQESHSKAEDSGRKWGELQLQLDITMCRVRELEEQLSIAEGKLKDAFAEIRQYSSHASELSSELEAFHVKSSSLETALQAANDTERELTDMLNRVTEEKNKIEESFKISGRKLLEAEILIEILQLELKSSMEKLQNVEIDLENSGDREREILEKSKLAVEMLYHQGRAVDKASGQSLDLMPYDSSANDIGEKLREEMLKFTEKDVEARRSLEIFKFLEEQAFFYKDQGDETTESLAAPKGQLAERSNKLASLEKTDELRTNHKITQEILEKSFIEYERLPEAKKSKGEIGGYQYKVDQYNDIGLCAHTEKDSSLKELERPTLINSEVKGSIEKLNYLQNQMPSFEKKIYEDSDAAEFQKAGFYGSLSKPRTLEGMLKEAQSKWTQLECDNEALTGENLKLTLDVTVFKTKLNDLQTALNTVLAESEKACGELRYSRETNEDLRQRLASEGERFQSQISSLIEENSLLNQRYEEANKQLQEVMAQMEGKPNEQREREYLLKDNVETLKVKSEMEARIAELERQLLSSETPLKEEVESIRALLGEKEATLAYIAEEKSGHAEEVVQLRREVNLQHKKFPEKRKEDVAESQSKDGVEPKSRDSSPTAGTASKINDDKRSKGPLRSSEGASTSPVATTEEPPAAMTFKFILGVVMASIFVGIILGKRF